MLTVNLFDSLFPQDTCSVHGAIPRHVQYTRGCPEWHGLTLFTDGWIFNDVVDHVTSPHKIAWLREPRCLWPDHYTDILNAAYKFDLVLTYDQKLIQHNPQKFVYTPYGGIWIPETKRRMYPKTKLCSMLIGHKRTTRGHQLRHEIAPLIQGTPGVDLYGYHSLPVGYGADTKLAVLRDYHYSFAIETCREPGLFTEWLLDCFATGTIPIFWGDPDVSLRFHSTGIRPFTTVKMARDIVQELSEADYTLRTPTIRVNLSRCQEYAITEDWVYRHILLPRGYSMSDAQNRGYGADA